MPALAFAGLAPAHTLHAFGAAKVYRGDAARAAEWVTCVKWMPEKGG